ncbi:MAG TPA: hypothetical protein VGF84_23950 [Micromonosporaceae bacterium]
MSVVVVVRIPGSPDSLESYANGPGAEVMPRVAALGRSAGATRHLFAGGDGEIVIVDEWPDEQSFQSFFNGQPEVADIMRDAGATGAPQISVYRKLNTPDAF